MFRYAANQEPAATAHVRQLQAGFTAAERRVRDAAPELLAALEEIARLRPAGDCRNKLIVQMERIALDAIARAKGAA